MKKPTRKEKLQVDQYAYLKIYDTVFKRLTPIKKNLTTESEVIGNIHKEQ